MYFDFIGRFSYALMIQLTPKLNGRVSFVWVKTRGRLVPKTFDVITSVVSIPVTLSFTLMPVV